MFFFDLCLALGCPHPDFLLGMLTSAQLTDWVAYYQLRPFGHVRESMLFGTLGAITVNLNTTGQRKFGWTDVFPIEGLTRDDDGRDTNERVLAMMKQYNERFR